MTDAQHRQECLSRFARAVDGYRRGDKAIVIAFLERIAAKHGADAAGVAKTELLAFAKSGKTVPLHKRSATKRG